MRCLVLLIRFSLSILSSFSEQLPLFFETTSVVRPLVVFLSPDNPLWVVEFVCHCATAICRRRWRSRVARHCHAILGSSDACAPIHRKISENIKNIVSRRVAICPPPTTDSGNEHTSPKHDSSMIFSSLFFLCLLIHAKPKARQPQKMRPSGGDSPKVTLSTKHKTHGCPPPPQHQFLDTRDHRSLPHAPSEEFVGI